MIFASNKLRLRYIENPKAACTSIKSALLSTDGIAHSDRQVHYTNMWDSCRNVVPIYTFTFVRHPFTRLVSSFREKLRTGRAARLVGEMFPLQTNATFHQWVGWVCSQVVERSNKHWTTQMENIRRHKLTKVDFVGQLETVAEHWKQLQSMFPGLADLPQYNVTESVEDVKWDCRTFRIAANYYAEDFVAFNYESDKYRPRPTIDAWTKIQGYMSAAEIEALQMLVKDKRVLEVGVWKGQSTIGMAATATHITAVDHFYGDSYAGLGNPGAETWKSICVNEARERVSLYTSDGIEAVSNLNLGNFEIVFYDACHSAFSTRSFLKRLKRFPSIIVAVHDYDNNPNHAGAREAIDHFAKQTNRTIDVVHRLAILKPSEGTYNEDDTA